MNIWHISDTHGMHDQLSIPEGIDMVMHTGDISSSKNLTQNGMETVAFYLWYRTLPIKYKILVPGNHDGLIEDCYKADQCEAFKSLLHPIALLIHESIEIEGVKIFGSPYTPTFYNWSFMKNRADLDNYWKDIPNETDIVITHGPPQGILDLASKSDGELEYCGDKALLRHILRVCPKYHLFGHIHDNHDCHNKGTRTIDNCRTVFTNSSCVTDGQFSNGLTSHGTIFEI